MCVTACSALYVNASRWHARVPALLIVYVCMCVRGVCVHASCCRTCRVNVSATRTSTKHCITKHCIIISLPSHRMTPHQNWVISTVIASSAGHRISHTPRIACSALCKSRFLLACTFVVNHKPCCTRNCGPQLKSSLLVLSSKEVHNNTSHI